MKEEVIYKLDRIADIWNSFIWEYEFCKKRIKFTPEVQTNYFGDILGYFQDTFDIIFDNRNSKSYAERFSNQISLLQSIYVQQDFIEELLIIFKCGINKGDLKKDSNYLINREIRNELVGHPIRKHNGKFISSCLFGYNGGSDKIVYLRYHKDNDYKFESMEYPVTEIIERHKEFLNRYFDKILIKLKKILTDFTKEIEKIESLIDKKSLEEILKISEVFYESIFEYDFIYDKESLLKINNRKEEHKRYKNLIDKFYQDLRSSLKEKREYAIQLFEPRKRIENNNIEKPIFDINFIDASEIKSDNIERPVTYHYELGKLATKRSPMDFDFFGGCLRRKCSENQLVLNELDHMESNIYNDIEYFTAYRLICTELNED
ncbi:hypothetical protein G3567_12940 [Psychroflexus sp. YR1-1]|uniref:Uncharacterized protein n=1 Tax=Psychroflexus aurantiacus TaxID=2709310 RepID=A0A6B3R3R4_9FLAO|nr:hypothetical protein [Psychroflexus aurantiacus]NEV95043.1 hypothetical protein [Psychroflexus aurantiacus]